MLNEMFCISEPICIRKMDKKPTKLIIKCFLFCTNQGQLSNKENIKFGL